MLVLFSVLYRVASNSTLQVSGIVMLNECEAFAALALNEYVGLWFNDGQKLLQSQSLASMWYSYPSPTVRSLALM